MQRGESEHNFLCASGDGRDKNSPPCSGFDILSMPADAVIQGLQTFGSLLGSLVLLAVAATVCWLLLFHFALKKLPPVQEALGLK